MYGTLTDLGNKIFFMFGGRKSPGIAIDHFSHSTRCFERLLENCALKLTLNQDSSTELGVSLRSDDAIHWNLSEDVIDTIETCVKSMREASSRGKSANQCVLWVKNATGSTMRYLSDGQVKVLEHAEEGSLTTDPLYTLVHDGDVVISSFENHSKLEALFDNRASKVLNLQDEILVQGHRTDRLISAQLKGFKWKCDISCAALESTFCIVEPEKLTLPHQCDGQISQALWCAIVVEKVRNIHGIEPQCA